MTKSPALKSALTAATCLSATALLGGCAALRGSMPEPELHAVIDEHIRPGDPAPFVREIFIELARPSHPDRLVLQEVTKRDGRTPPDAHWLLPTVIEQEYVFPFAFMGAEVTFFFDLNQRLITYSLRRFGGAL